jgi:gas vesicle protein
MISGKIITGAVIGTVIALLIIPKTRRMLSDAVCTLTDSFKDVIDKAGSFAEQGKDEIGKIADKAKDASSYATRTAKEAWQA